ncbi:hypothetical protein [Ekhidna sp.]
MKLDYLIAISLIMLYTNTVEAQPSKMNLDVLVGSWNLDMTPQDPSDDKFAKMNISSVGENSIEGTFYREGVKIREGRINVSGGTIYVALVSKDNSGTYNTSFYLKEGMLYGTTHAIDKNFLAVWEGEKLKK